jgi:hypothetical protein
MADWRIDPAKILRYLLNDQSPSGMGKARFFRSFGFNRTQWELLRDALLAHPRTAPLEEVDASSPYGVKLASHCNVAAPDGRSPCIRTVWQHRGGTWWLVTAYPFG